MKMDDHTQKLLEKLGSLLENVKSNTRMTEKRRNRLMMEFDEISNTINDINKRQTELNSKLDALDKSLSFFES